MAMILVGTPQTAAIGGAGAMTLTFNGANQPHAGDAIVIVDVSFNSGTVSSVPISTEAGATLVPSSKSANLAIATNPSTQAWLLGTVATTGDKTVTVNVDQASEAVGYLIRPTNANGCAIDAPAVTDVDSTVTLVPATANSFGVGIAVAQGVPTTPSDPSAWSTTAMAGNVEANVGYYHSDLGAATGKAISTLPGGNPAALTFFSLKENAAAGGVAQGSRRGKSNVRPGKRGVHALAQFVRARRSNTTSPNISVGLTGVAGTAAVGSLAPSTSVATSGNAATSAVGTAAPSLSAALTGNAGASSVGSVTAQASAIVGSRRRSQGLNPAVTPYNLRKFYKSARSTYAPPNVFVALTGVAGTGSPGTLAPANSVPVTGNAATGAVGTVTPTRSVAVTGNAATGAVGTLAPASAVPLTGASATGGTGTISPQQAGSAAISGVAGTVSAGTATPNTSVATSGVQGAGSVGTVGQSRTVALTGASATGVVGSVNSTSDIVVALSGNSASAQVGSLVPARSAALTGLVASTSVGRIEIPTDYTTNSSQRIGRKTYPGTNGTRIGS